MEVVDYFCSGRKIIDLLNQTKVIRNVPILGNVYAGNTNDIDTIYGDTVTHWRNPRQWDLGWGIRLAGS